MDSAPNVEALRGKVLADPTHFPQKLDLVSQRLLLVHFTPDAYRRASFLDDRVLGPDSRGSWVRLDEIDAALAQARPALPLHFIFHAGHVGSTLVSRLLEDTGGVLALREPMPLRTLAEAHDALGNADSLVSPEAFERLLRQQIVLWSRGFADTRAVVVKATSATARIAPSLLAAAPDSCALYLYLPLEPYLATLLAGENSHIDLRGHAGERMRRLLRFGVEPPAPLHAMNLGEIAALAWTAERLSQHALEDAAGARVTSVDFGRLIAEPEPGMRHICTHFQLAADEAYFRQIAANPAWRQYAKAPEHAYSPDLRAQILAQARVEKASEIRSGLAWFDTLAARYPVLERLRV